MISASLVLVSVSLEGCGSQGQTRSCVAYTTSESQRRGYIVSGAARAKERYDLALYEQESISDKVRRGDSRWLRHVEPTRQLVEDRRQELDRANTELDRLSNEPALCPNPAD